VPLWGSRIGAGAGPARANPIGDELRRIGRPRDRRAVVVVAFRSVGTEGDTLLAADLANGDVVIVDEGHPLAVGRYPRPRSGRRSLRAHGPGDAAADLTRRRHIGRAAGVVGQRARPARTVDGHVDRAQRLVEREVVEGQACGRIGAARRARQRLRNTGVIEGALLALGIRVDNDPLESVGDRPPVIEAMCRPRPPRRLGHQDRRRLVLLSQRLRALVLAGRDLCRCPGCRDHDQG